MNERITFLVSDELFQKAEEMREAGLNVSQILRNCLANYPFQLEK